LSDASSDGSLDGSVIGLLPRSFRSSVAYPVAHRTDHSSAYFLISSARQWLTGRITHRLTSSFLPLVSGLPDGSPDRLLISLLPRSFHSSMACLTARLTDCSLAYFLVPSARQWLAQRFLGRIPHWLTSLFLPLVSGLLGSPDGLLIGLLPCFLRSSVARRTDRSSAYFLIPFAHQWLARLAGQSAHWLTSSFLPLVSSLPGSPDGSLIGLLPHSFHSSVARQTDRSSAYFLVSSAHQWLARRLAGQIIHRLTSSFLPLISRSPDGSLIGLLPCSFHSSVTFPMPPRTDCSSAYFLVPSARQWLSRWLLRQIAHRLTSSSFRSSMACQTDRSSAYFLVPSAHQWLA